ncbi:MAG: TetR family transcriptional regulator [Actinomycetota bacterium]
MDGLTTKQKIVEAALQTLKDEGFAGTSARAIARRGDFNQALIFYHFGTLNDLLLAALDATSAARMQRYETELMEAGTLEDKLKVATDLYREDLASGHITVVSEMIAGSLSRPDLGPEIVARLEPWVEFAERMIAGALAGSFLESLIDPKALAGAVVAMYLGVDLLSHLDGDRSRAEELFAMVERIAPMAMMLRG